jgi:catechol 2,3-dioxygenase-like lactoylglutathione lyase family enzyme
MVAAVAFSWPMLESLDHAIIAVRDLAAAAETYTALLGRLPSWRGEHPGLGTENVLFRLDNTTLELLCPGSGQGPAAAIRARLEEKGEGLLGLAFGTEDADLCRAELARRGLHPAAPRSGLGRARVSGAVREFRSVFLPREESRGLLLFAIQHLSPPELLPPARLAAPAASAVSGVDHVVVRTVDPESAKHLYGHQLGIRLALDRIFEQWGARLLFFRIGGLTVEISASLAGEVGAGAEDELWGIAYRVPDADGARERLAGHGFDVSEVRRGRKPGTRVFTVRSETHGVATLCLEASPKGNAPAVDGETASAP